MELRIVATPHATGRQRARSVALVVDLAEPRRASDPADAFAAIAEATIEARELGDRIRILVAGGAATRTLEGDDVRHGAVALALDEASAADATERRDGALAQAVRSAVAAGVGIARVGEHPVTAAFPSGQDNLSEYVRFRSYYRLAQLETDAASQPASQPAAVVLAKYADETGTPALLERRIGRGRSLLFTSTIDLTKQS